MTLSEKIEKILEEVLMKHHILFTNNDAIAEARDAILEVVEEELLTKEEMTGIIADTMVRINRNDFTAPQYFMREEEIAEDIAKEQVKRLEQSKK